MMMLATLLFLIFSLDGTIQTYEGIILFAILCAFTYLLIRNSRKKTKQALQETISDIDEIAAIKDGPLKATAFLILGLVGLYFGATWLLDGAVSIAKDFGMEERVIAVTIVAFGTSVPELITSAIAAFKKETDISIGNLIGSNIFNIMAVIGITAMVKPIQVSEATINSDMWWVVGIALALLPIMIIGKKVGRIKGALLLSSYIVYIGLMLISIN
jgi:cation:H+ antiporter